MIHKLILNVPVLLVIAFLSATSGHWLIGLSAIGLAYVVSVFKRPVRANGKGLVKAGVPRWLTGWMQ